MPVLNTPASLARVGITRLTVVPLELKCNQCGTTWRPAYDAKGHLPVGWWKCPQNQSHTIDWDAISFKPMPERHPSGTQELKKK